MLFLISINYIDRASLSVAMPLIGKEFDIGSGDSRATTQLILLDLCVHAGARGNAR